MTNTYHFQRYGDWENYRYFFFDFYYLSDTHMHVCFKLRERKWFSDLYFEIFFWPIHPHWAKMELEIARFKICLAAENSIQWDGFYWWLVFSVFLNISFFFILWNVKKPPFYTRNDTFKAMLLLSHLASLDNKPRTWF